MALAVYEKTALEMGRGKYQNIMITGPANCAKTFILKPLTLLFDTFCNPASGSFAWVGVQDKECIFLNDFCWFASLIPWHLLEGEPVHLPAPKTHFSHDIQLVKDTPIFCATKRPLMYIKNGRLESDWSFWVWSGNHWRCTPGSSHIYHIGSSVSVNGGLSMKFPLNQGVPQGSCLGPLLFTVYTRKLFQIVEDHLPQVHCYGWIHGDLSCSGYYPKFRCNSSISII